MKTLLIGEIHGDAKSLLEQNTDLTTITGEDFIHQESFPETEAVVLRTFTTFKENEINKFPNLKYVVSCSVGINNLDLEKLKEKNIQLVHCPGTNANSVAEHTLYFMLTLLRQDSKKPFAELKGKTVGIVGLGAIGKIVARKLLGFEAKVIAFDVIEQDLEVLKELQVEMKSMDEVLSNSDIITVHVPLNKYTGNLVNAECFNKMKENSFFINTSRAEIIEESALIENQNKFRGIALDVCSEELSGKLNHGNLLITDHCAAQGEDSFRKMCVKPVEEFLEKIKESQTQS